MQSEQHWSILTEPLALWAANCNAQNVPDVVKCNGNLPVDDYKHITFFIAESKSKEFISNLCPNARITFLATRIHDFVSYQYKGIFKSIRSCSQAEVDLQLDHVDKLTNEFVKLGLNKEQATLAYFHQPSVAITFEVQEIFEQTPRKGTGGTIKQNTAV